MSFRQGARQFFERRGAPTPPLPYDYEVAYIERDFTKKWMVAGAEIAQGGFDISEYMPSGAVNTYTQEMCSTFSFSPNSSRTAIAIGAGKVVWGSMIPYMSLYKSNSSTKYVSAYGSSLTSSVDGTLDTFHTMRIVPDGAGNAEVYIDATDIGTASGDTKVPTMFGVLVAQNKASSAQCQMRVKNVRFGSTVYLIPVKKGNAVGFYNIVDGHLFLEEQACLSAGPRV